MDIKDRVKAANRIARCQFNKRNTYEVYLDYDKDSIESQDFGWTEHSSFRSVRAITQNKPSHREQSPEQKCLFEDETPSMEGADSTPIDEAMRQSRSWPYNRPWSRSEVHSSL